MTNEEPDRAMAELLALDPESEDERWPGWYFASDLNQARAAVLEWCGEDARRKREWLDQLAEVMPASETFTYDSMTASAEQMCRALVQAAKEIEGK